MGGNLSEPNKNLEFSLAGGFNWYNVPNTYLVISPFETDSVQVRKSSNEGIGKIGLGYYLFDERLQERNYINHLLVEVNYYYSSTKARGSVWQYELPEFMNYTFRSNISSNRLMFDFKPHLFTWHTISPYAILGIGSVWNKVSYTETPADIDIDFASRLLLPSSTKTKFSYNLGAGFSLNLNNYISATVEYLYASLGHSSSAKRHHNRVNLASPPQFSLHTQSLLFGLSLKI